ncbi:MAG TPA: recombination mediator RecR [Candidatus Binatia bacterium]|jgi:recombination protein RecR|nr:recombination mediator RecR [Candidatus Binatia bacterium]
MTAYPAPLARLIQELSKLPGIGEKTAARLAFHLLKGKREDAMSLADSIGKLRQAIGLCRQCFGFSEVNPQSDDGTLCTVCRNPERAKDTICVVEEPGDLIAVEKSQEFKGLYHVLHGTISPLDGVGPDALRIRELLDRIQQGSVREVIVATNPTMDGEATALYLSKVIKPLGIAVTRIARGLPMGGDLEYIDAVTLGKALEGRREI